MAELLPLKVCIVIFTNSRNLIFVAPACGERDMVVLKQYGH